MTTSSRRCSRRTSVLFPAPRGTNPLIHPSTASHLTTSRPTAIVYLHTESVRAVLEKRATLRFGNRITKNETRSRGQCKPNTRRHVSKSMFEDRAHGTPNSRRGRPSTRSRLGCGGISGHDVLQVGARISVFSNKHQCPGGARATVLYSTDPNRVSSLHMSVERAVPVKKTERRW